MPIAAYALILFAVGRAGFGVFSASANTISTLIAAARSTVLRAADDGLFALANPISADVRVTWVTIDRTAYIHGASGAHTIATLLSFAR